MILIKKYFIFIFAFSFLLLSYIPNIYEASVVNKLPNDRTMIWGEHSYTYDYNVYLSKIRQGQEGRFTVVDKYDNHPEQKGAFLQIFYLLLGKLTKPFGFSPILTYHLARVFLSVIWVMLIITLNIYFLKKLSLVNLGVILSLLTASFPVFYQFQDQWWITYYMNWWQELDILKRISFIPHDTVNYIFVSIFTILLSLLEKDKKYFSILYILIFISVFIHPAGAILFIASWTLYHLIKMFMFESLSKNYITNIIKQTFVLIISVLLPLLYIKFATSTYPWKSLLDFDLNHRGVLNIKDYILSLGPIFITGITGAFFVLIKKKIELLPLVAWIFGAAICIFLFKFFPYQTELRFIQTANHIPLAILSAYLFGFFIKKYKDRLSIYSIYILISLIVILGIVQAVYSIKSQAQFIDQRARATLPLVPNPPQIMYPLTDFYNGLIWLENNTGKDTVVLSKITAGNYIPAYSGNFVYLGHGSETPHYEQRSLIASGFFSGNLTEKEAYEFLKTEHIGYIFYGPQEKENSQKDISTYQFLKPVFQSNQVIIYKVSL